MQQKKNWSYSHLRMTLQLSGSFILYVLGVRFGILVIPVAISFLRLGRAFTDENWFWWVAGAIVILLFFGILQKRIRFVMALKRTCKRYGFRLFDVRRLFLSMFFGGKKYHFGVEANGKTYFCRLLPCMNRMNKTVISDNGTFTRVFALHIPQPQFARAGGFVQTYDRGSGEDREFLHFESTNRYAFEIEGKGEKILLLNPVPRRVRKKIHGHITEVDNGDMVGEYRVFTGNAFLRALERDGISDQ